MPAKLFEVSIGSTYFVANHPVLLPKRMAMASADMKAAIAGLQGLLRAEGGALVLSDLFRSYDMQLQAHLDFVNKKKKAFSPPPGGSFHESGRAFDLDLGKIRMPLADLWKLAAKVGLVPIIATPDKGKSEAWHFECRGSHQRVQAYYEAGKGTNFDSPYKAAAASAIVSIGIHVDAFKDGQSMAYIQSGLIRLGQQIGNMDGQIGPKTRAGLTALGINAADPDAALAGMDAALQHAFPEEYFDGTAAGTGSFLTG